jgi:hypothetical protein
MNYGAHAKFVEKWLDKLDAENEVATATATASFADLPPPPAPQPGDPAAPAPLAPAPTIYDLQCPTLLHTSRVAGQDMPLAQFCTDFKLSDKVFEKLRDNGYQNARVLRFLMIDELKEMNFLLGEIAALRDAVEMWSVPRVA